MHESLGNPECTLAASPEAAALLDALFSLSGLGVVHADCYTWRFLNVNERFCQITGYSREELLGMTITDLSVADARQMDLSGMEERFFHNEDLSVEKRYRRKDGSVVWVRVDGQVVYGPDRQPRCTLGLVREITEWKETEARLQARDQRLRSMVEHLAAAAVYRDGDTLYVNHAAQVLTGYSGEELGTLQRWFRVLHRTSHASARDEYELDRALGFLKKRTIPILRKDGSERVIELSRYGYGDGEVWLLHDVTERERVEQRLRNSHRQLRELTARMVEAQEQERRSIARDLHDDLGQRMAGLLFDLSSLTEKAPADSPVREAAANVTERLREVARDLQLMSRQLHSAVLEKIGLAAALRSECDAIGRKAKAEVAVEIRGSIPKIPDPVALSLYRVFQEATQNALKHSGAKRLQVTLAAEGNRVLLSVRDFGRGFDAAAAMIQGGLGLLSMQERMRACGGELRIQSAPEAGTVVEVSVTIEGESREAAASNSTS